MSDVKPPSGRTIVLELQREMESRLYPLMYRTLPPAVYPIYLHPDDYSQVQPITAAIIADAQQGLSTRVDELNRRSRWSRFVSDARAPIEAPPGGWEIYLHPETNGELAAGELGIESRLLLPTPPRFEGGTLRRTTSEVLDAPEPPLTSAQPGTPQLASMPQPVPMPAAAPPTPLPAASAAGGDSETATARPATTVHEGTGGTTARLTYIDDAGPHDYAMRKDLISIGRGGSAHWVDVQVVSSTRVSREHCRIRRASDGRFFLQDVSTWGTSVDGHRVEPFARQQEGQVEEVGHEYPLTTPARIQLADAVVIDFALEP
jgi:pSer/pThr/pTyr-binding forkhead associated (FHA) protein